MLEKVKGPENNCFLIVSSRISREFISNRTEDFEIPEEKCRLMNYVARKKERERRLGAGSRGRNMNINSKGSKSMNQLELNQKKHYRRTMPSNISLAYK